MMEYIKTPFTWFVIVVIVVIAGALVYVYVVKGSNGYNGKVYTVELREDGFFPATTTVKKGDTVRFVTTKEKNFWPASSEHPAHGAYTAFDAKRPISPDAAWEFTFTQRGAWEFHDHLYSFYKGTIIVE